MCDLERGRSLSFSGCGFLSIYHVGVTSCLSERAPHLLRDARMFFGSSSGAVHGVVFLAGIPVEKAVQIFMGLVQSTRRRNIGIFHPSINVGKQLRKYLHRHLPANVHQLISGKMCISLTRVSDGQNVLVSDFQSKDEVVDALFCSCFLPFYCGFIPPSFRGVRYIDGGISDNIPFTDAKTTITVSPFYGECDICPKVKTMNFLHVDMNKLSLYVCSENVYLLCRAMFPPDVKVLAELCFQGYLDTLKFLEKNGICSVPRPCLSAASEGLTQPREYSSTESSQGVAARDTRPGADEPRSGHLRLRILPSHESIPEALMPKLRIVLNAAIKNQSGYMSKICNFLPVKVLSYMLLPCTLPVESAIAMVQSLVMWLPDAPDDIRWLQRMTCQTCSRLMVHLFPSRSQVPASSQRPFPHQPEHHGTVDQGAHPLDCAVGAKGRI
ncbi:1-acylglycerol-3-phosphate O-acyltransferase PNPLA3 isoform X1 [Manis javanica]|uniref:1-acylglycerol-3-phosphate O-acyltransferase PNPLA3 isoform X1 n=2 Tax=Manis javanica TaxID=9974 RepID=UPI003C6CE152